jgi:hypothetical protein
LNRAGYIVIEVDVSEFRKSEGGLVAFIEVLINVVRNVWGWKNI